jgi:hypothetical protein
MLIACSFLAGAVFALTGIWLIHSEKDSQRRPEPGRLEPKGALHCTFCGKSQHEVRKLLAGPGVFICDECVVLCIDILHAQLADENECHFCHKKQSDVSYLLASPLKIRICDECIARGQRIIDYKRASPLSKFKKRAKENKKSMRHCAPPTECTLTVVPRRSRTQRCSMKSYRN